MGADYVKVTSAPTNWAGEYVLVGQDKEGNNYAFSGVDVELGSTKLTLTKDTIYNYEGVSLNIVPIDTAYVLKVIGGANDGKFMSSGSTAPTYTNALKFVTDSTRHQVKIELDKDLNANLIQTTSSGDVSVRFNYASDQMRFRFYKSGQQPVQLYKKVEAVSDTTTVLPDTTVTTTYTVNLTVNGMTEGDNLVVGADKNTETYEPAIALSAGANSIEAGNYIFVTAWTEAANREVAVTIDGEAIELGAWGDWVSPSSLAANMDIVVNFSEAAPVVRDTVVFVANQEGGKDYSTDLYAWVAKGDTAFYFDIDYPAGKKSLEPGVTYTFDQMEADYTSLYIISTKEETPASDATYCYTIDEQGLKHVAATMAVGNVFYKISYDQPKPDTIAYTLPAEIIDLTSRGLMQIVAFNADSTQAVSMVLRANQIEGTYDLATAIPSTYASYNWAGNYVADELYALKGGVVTIAKETSEAGVFYRISGLVNTAQDYYDLNLTTTPVPVVTDTVVVKIAAPKWSNYVAKEGWWQITGYTADSTIYVSLSNGDEVTEVVGTYDMAAMDASFTYIVEKGTKQAFETITVKAEIVNDTAYHFSAIGKTVLGTTYAFDFAPVGDPELKGEIVGDDYDMQEEAEYAYTTNDLNAFKTSQLSSGVKYSYIQMADSETTFATYLFFDGAAESLPAGTYNVQDGFAAGNAMPCDIDLQQGSVMGTYFANLSASGNLSLPLYMAESGTVTVSYDEAGNLNLEANLVNTWGKAGHFTMTTATTPIVVDTVEVTCTYYYGEDYEGTDFYLEMAEANSDIAYCFDILYPEGKTALEPGVTYTLDQMLADFTNIYDYETEETIEDAISATFCYTLDEQGLMHIEATMGTKLHFYKLSYVQKPAPTFADTVRINIAKPRWTNAVAAAGFWHITGYSADSTFYVSFSNGEDVEKVAGDYTLADMDPDYTAIYYFYEDRSSVALDLATASIKAEIVDTTYVFSVNATDVEGHHFIITFAPVPDSELVDDDTKIYTVADKKTQKDGKFLKSNVITIVRDDKRFNLMGTQVQQ